MDFDIDAVLDQLEKTLNQSDLEEKDTNQIIQTSPPISTSRKSVDELLLLDLDPLGSIENHNNNNSEENENKLERFKQDLEELYASSTVIDPLPAPAPPSMQTPTLPDIIGQQEEFSSTSLPLAVEQLELEVRQEILHHTFEQPSSSSLLLPDLTTLTNGHYDENKEAVLFSTSFEDEEQQQEQENLSSTPVIETTQISNNLVYQNEPDLIQHETPSTQAAAILHSVDSIVNAPMGSDFEDFVAPNLPVMDSEPFQSSPELVFTSYDDNNQDSIQSSSELVFTACDDKNQESIQSLPSEEPIDHSPTPSPPPPSSTTNTTAAPTQDFDLVKNILSEIFDKPDEEILDENPTEEKESELVNIEQQEISPPPTVTTNNDEDFRFLDEMLASIDVSDGDIHQLTPAEIDRVDNLLKQIVSSHQTEETVSPSITNEIEPGPSSEEQPPSMQSSLLPQSQFEGAAAAIPVDEELIRVEHEWSKLTEEEKRLGSIAPEWVSDDLAPACMKCAAKFSITRRRHHCRACGKVFCSTCCWQKVKLIHDDSKEDRACHDCVKTINNVEYLWNYMRNNQKPRSSVLRKKTGTSVATSETSTNSYGRQGSDHKKSVTFDDGVKPGVETTATSAAAVAATNIMSSHKIRPNETDIDQVSLFKPETLTQEEFEERIRRLKDPNEPPIEFRIHNNLIVISKIVDNFDCYLNRNGGHCWIFSTRGLCAVAQDELIFIFEENINNANDIISDLLIHIHQIYVDATKGSFVRHLGISLSSSFVGSSTTAGFLYVSDPTLSYSLFPDAPYLFGILIHQSELPTAQCFPMRLLLRLGYEYQSYPWPLFSILNRDSMFSDTQHTIMSLLCDFRSFTYILPTIRGLIISVGIQGSVSIRIPRNRHDDILKSLEQSSPHALSFGIMNINRQTHSKHLVTIQNSTDQQYETRIFSSLDSNNEQIMIGGNFLVVNASLRSRDSPPSSPLDIQNSGSFSLNNNLNAKVNTIEDGIMLQIDGDALKILKQCLKERKDYAILAKARSIIIDEQNDSTNGNIIKKNSSEQLVEFIWIDDDNDVNRGVCSPIDHFPMDGIRNSRIHYAGQRSPSFRLRWTDLFFVECYLNSNESFDPTRLADSLAKAFIQALTPYIDMLVEAKYRKLGLRVTIDRENASYIAGSNGEQLPPFFLSQLDDHMIPIVMKASDNVSRAAPSLVLELVFYLLD